jgi:hypothetical protein
MQTTKQHDGYLAQEIKSADYREDSILIKDYSGKHTFNITQPFSRGVEVGGISLDSEGHRLTVVNKNATYLYLYLVEATGPTGKVT